MKFVHSSICGFKDIISVCLLGRELCAFEHQDHINCIKFNPVNHSLFVSGLTNRMLSWDKRCPSKPVRQYVYKDRFGQVIYVHFFCVFSRCTEQARSSI